MTAHTTPALETLRAERDEAQRRVEGLSHVIELISSELALQPLLTRIVECAVELTGAQCGNIGLVKERPSGLVVEMAAVVNLPARVLGLEYPLGVGLSGSVVAEQRPIYLDRYGDLPSMQLPELAEHTVIGIPIWWAQRVIGVFCIGAEPPRRFSDQDAETLTLFARHAAIAIENARLFGGLQRAFATTELLYRTSHRISTAMRVEEVIVAYLEQVAGGGRYHSSVATDELDQQGRRRGLLVHGRWNPQRGMQLEQERLPYLFTGFDAELDAGRVITMRDVHAEPCASKRFRQAQRRVGRVAVALIPLIVRGRRFGLVGLSHPDPHDWLETELQPFQVTAALLASAIDSRRQHLLLAERGQELAVLEERRRLARELHDSVTQSLVGVNMMAQTVPDLWTIDRQRAEGLLGQISNLTRSALEEMRELLFELRPPGQGGLSLAEALKQQAAWFEGRTGLVVQAELEETAALPDGVRQALLRIAQEALTNISRHAEARRVTLSLRGGRSTRLTVVDDGRGFLTGQVGERSFGLISMRERAANIQARLTLRSAPGAGTEIVVEWPDPGSNGRRRGTDDTDTNRDRGRPPDRPAGPRRRDGDPAGHGAGRRGAKRSRSD